MSSSETQLPSTDSNDHRMSVVIQNPVFDLVNENESNVESIITDCDLPADLEEQLKALQTFDPTFNIFALETGKFSLKYDKARPQSLCRTCVV